MTHKRIDQVERELLDLLAQNNGYYDAVNEKGERVGKLVGYAGTYETPWGTKHWVGTRYWNFPRGAERNPKIMDQFTERIWNQIYQSCYDHNQPKEIHCMFGCPEGGIVPAYDLARQFRCCFSRADKKVLEAATPERREKSKLILGRHTIEPYWNVAIVDDVLNNTTTTGEAIELVESEGATVVAILCMINRSPNGLYVYEYKGREIEILSAVTIPTQEYHQDDPKVAEDIRNGNVIWKPKDKWEELIQSIS